MREKVTVFGSCVVDLMSRAPHLPVPGETVRGGLFMEGPGGKGFNQGVAAHKAGADVAMVTKLGRDRMANIALEAMDALGMLRDFLFFSESVGTGTALILVDENSSQNMIIIVPGACATFNAEDIAIVKRRILESAYLLLQLEVNQDANEQVASFAKENGVRVIINTAPYQPITDEFLSGAYLVTPNEVEAEGLTGVRVSDLESADRAARVFLDKGVQNVLITMGAQGVYVNTEGHSQIIPAFKVKAVDTTGAGDVYHGAFMASWLRRHDLGRAMRFASVVAALKCRKPGGRAGIPTMEEAMAALARWTG